MLFAKLSLFSKFFEMKKVVRIHFVFIFSNFKGLKIEMKLMAMLDKFCADTIKAAEKKIVK